MAGSRRSALPAQRSTAAIRAFCCSSAKESILAEGVGFELLDSPSDKSAAVPSVLVSAVGRCELSANPTAVLSSVTGG